MGMVERTLIKARRLLIDYGWIKGDFESECNGKVCYCTEGAIHASSIDWNIEDEAHSVFIDANPSVTRNFNNSIPDWNDVARRRKGQVIKAFDKAIELAKQRGV